MDPDNRVTGFEEKPKVTQIRAPGNPDRVPASMGVYLFNTDVLIPVLLKDAEDETSSHDFGKDILPKMVDDYRVYAFDFVDENKKEALYWRDVGTLEAYYEANMDVVSVSPVFNLYDSAWPIRTHQRQYPPAKFVFEEPGRTGQALDSIVSAGCIVSGGAVRYCSALARCARELLHRSRFQHPFFSRERRPPLPHSAGNHRPRRAHPRGHYDRL